MPEQAPAEAQLFSTPHRMRVTAPCTVPQARKANLHGPHVVQDTGDLNRHRVFGMLERANILIEVLDIGLHLPPLLCINEHSLGVRIGLANR